MSTREFLKVLIFSSVCITLKNIIAKLKITLNELRKITRVSGYKLLHNQSTFYNANNSHMRISRNVNFT